MHFEPIGRQDILEQVSVWQKAREQWHFHMLTPECVFNPKHGSVHCIVLENRTTAKTFVFTSEFRDMALGKQLAQIIHAEVFQNWNSEPIAEWLAAWQTRMEHLNGMGLPWHHHMLFPNCALNPHPGNWVLVFEDPEDSLPQMRVFAEEPSVEFRAIERMYWAQRG